MQQPSEREPFSLHRIWTGRGAYLLFALILLAVSGVGVAIYAVTDSGPADNDNTVGQHVSDVPDNRTVPSAPSPTQPSIPSTTIIHTNRM